MSVEEMEAEFGVLAAWTADAVRRLGPEYAIAAACKGSASPGALGWLASVCGLREGSLLVDVGGGMGGPVAFARRRFGVRPVVLEPMGAACRAARDLFAVPAWRSDGQRLPLADGSVDAVWCLGVLCTTPDRHDLLAEIVRVMKPGARLGLLVFTADEPRPPGAPEGNVFPAAAELPGMLAEHGLTIVGTVGWEDVHDQEEDEWRRLAGEVQTLVDRLHDGDPRLDEVHEQERRIGRLIRDGVVRAMLIGAVLG
ncbi:methyltransferase domain-containing protein [Kineosporia sp. J2-2]|uniref:Methyltransferase domain-containing protein n=1 Tax=Kineosporia corallincola TaxID=2835133 RepID=A0ABS5TJE3_9ACTN|nr:class I SAM-dependent methyltransferase [Kineosporia corallincola]MBT0769689.1 methyltransferase domain-containing protein [Kineosporia corallincola]